MASRTCAERGLIRGWLLLDCIGVPFSPLPSATQIGQTSPRKFGAQGQLDQVTSLLTTPGSRLFPPNGMKIAECLTARLAQWKYQRETDTRRCAAGPRFCPEERSPTNLKSGNPAYIICSKVGSFAVLQVGPVVRTKFRSAMIVLMNVRAPVQMANQAQGQLLRIRDPRC